MRKITAGELNKILEEHERWLENEGEGEKADLSEADLGGADLSEADLSEANLIGASLSLADLSGANLCLATLFNADLEGANLSNADLSGAILHCADLINADLSDAALYEAGLNEANLTGANLSQADLEGADLSLADLSGANLRGTDFTGTTLSGANLREVDLCETIHEVATLSGADLSYANLSNLDLSGANLRDATLRGAILHCADLINADLSNADLSQADLGGADLSEADLSEANLIGANLIRVRGLTLEQFSVVKTLYGARLGLERMKQVRKKYPHLLDLHLWLKKVTLRSSYKTLSVSEVQSMPNVSISEKDNCGFFGHSTINHDYNLKTIKGDKVVVDNATGLMWHQSSSDDGIMWVDEVVNEWVEDLNSEEGYAGYNDWRLPTLEEAVSLLESSRKNGALYIDPVFSKINGIWTGDKFKREDGTEVVWDVLFDNGSVSTDLIPYPVRPVRFVYDSDEEPEEEDQEEEEDEEKLSKSKIITLRSSYKTLSVSEVHSMPNVSVRKKEEWGFDGHSTINHDYNLKTAGGDKVVVDNATGLMWHQSGSDNYVVWDEVNEWVEDLNSEEGYAGYHDWKLPTVEEAASLLEANEENGDLCIDPVFSNKQIYIWTGDKTDYGSEAPWIVYFSIGSVSRHHSIHYVRPVRSVE
jgi:uncharacterized protein YjbI with pentapeptide repeats